MPPEKYIYSDVDKGLTVNGSGNVKVLYDVDVIIQSLKMIIGAFSGEYVRSPIGSRIMQFVGRTMTESVAEDIKDEVVAMISEYEPRVEILGVMTQPLYDLNQYRIRIRLKIRTLGETLTYNTRIPAL